MVFREDNLLGLGGIKVFIVDPVDGLTRLRNAEPFNLEVGFPFSLAIVLEKVPEPNPTILLLFSLSIPIWFRGARKH